MNIKAQKASVGGTLNERIRLTWVDCGKALLIFLVIYNHVIVFSFNHYGKGVITSFICSFYMPLFFFLSGMFMKDNNDVSRLAKRAVNLMVPFLVLGSLFTWRLGDSYESLFLERMHNGYWFILALFSINIVFYLRNIIAQNFLINRPFWADLIAIIVSDAIFAALYCFVCKEITYAVALNFVKDYLPYFIAGYWYMRLRVKKELKLPLWVAPLGFALYVVLNFVDLSNTFHGIASLLEILKQHAATLSSGVFVLCLLERIPSSFKGDKWVKYVGRHTLEIYVLHYLFIPLGIYDMFSSMLGICEMTDCLLITLIALVFITFVSLICRLTDFPFLRLILYGKW